MKQRFSLVAYCGTHAVRRKLNYVLLPLLRVRSSNIQHAAIRCILALLPLTFPLISNARTDWPAGDVVYAASKSPDGHYGIVLPGREAGTGGEEDKNYLANLTTRQLLGEIAGVDYFEGENHRDLHVVWAPDSSWCVATYDERYGFGSIYVLRPNGSEFAQIDVGEHIQKAISGVVESQSHGGEDGCYGVPYFHARADGKLLVRAIGYTNPKSVDNMKTYYAFFEGTFDMNSRKWTAEHTRVPGSAGDSIMDGAYNDYRDNECIVIPDPAGQPPEDFIGTFVHSDEEKAGYVEQRLNQVYAAVRFALPANRFSAVKQDQKAWLKKREALGSVKEKYQLTEARIKWLQQLLW